MRLPWVSARSAPRSSSWYRRTDRSRVRWTKGPARSRVNKLLNDPARTLEAEGIDNPAAVTVKIAENSP